MRNTYGAQSCHLLVINSKPKKGAIVEPSLPAPDPWLRFLPRKQSKVVGSLSPYFDVSLYYVLNYLKAAHTEKGNQVGGSQDGINRIFGGVCFSYSLKCLWMESQL